MKIRMKKTPIVALFLSSAASFYATASNIDNNAFIEEVARISVLDWSATPDTRKDLISEVLGSEYVEMFEGSNEGQTITSEHVVASFLTYLSEKPNLDLEQLLRAVVETSRNQYTYVIDGHSNNRKRNIIEFDEECTVITKEALSRATVIDLSGNTGGSLSCAIKVAEKLLPFGYTTVSTIHSNLGDETTLIQGKNRLDSYKKTRKVIVDADTASAAEFLAFSLKDAGWQVVFRNGSEHTYGKNWTQSKHKFRDLAYVLTTGYYTVGECKIEGCRLIKQPDYVSLSATID